MAKQPFREVISNVKENLPQIFAQPQDLDSVNCLESKEWVILSSSN